MILFPAIDLIDGQAVRLVKGDYNRMTVYEKKALNAALRFQNAGAKYLHLVDLQGQRTAARRIFPPWKRLSKIPICGWKSAAAFGTSRRWNGICSWGCTG